MRCLHIVNPGDIFISRQKTALTLYAKKTALTFFVKLQKYISAILSHCPPGCLKERLVHLCIEFDWVARVACEHYQRKTYKEGKQHRNTLR